MTQPDPVRHKTFFVVEPEEGAIPFQLVMTGYTKSVVEAEALTNLLPEALEKGSSIRVEAMILNVGKAPWEASDG